MNYLWIFSEKVCGYTRFLKVTAEYPDFFKLTSWMNRYVDIRTTQHTDTTDVFSVLRAQIVECVPGIRLYGGS